MDFFISGIAGFLGSHIAERLIMDGHRVAGIDNLAGGFRENVPTGAEFLETDCLDIQSYESLIRPNCTIFHCAASAHDGFSIWSPARIYQDTVQATVALLSCAANRGARRFVFCSSMARYGSPDGDHPFIEGDPTCPVTPYGHAKIAAESAVRNIAQLHGLEWNIAVPHNIYGPRQNRTDPYRNVVAIMMNRVLLGLPPVVYGNGSQVRCFSHVDDVVEPLMLMGTREDITEEVINIGPDEDPTSIRQLALMVTEALGAEPSVVNVPQRPFEVHYATCSANKARRVLGFTTRRPLKQGIPLTADWFRTVGPLPFSYDRPVEIIDHRMPTTWSKRLI